MAINSQENILIEKAVYSFGKFIDEKMPGSQLYDSFSQAQLSEKDNDKHARKILAPESTSTHVKNLGIHEATQKLRNKKEVQ